MDKIRVFRLCLLAASLCGCAFHARLSTNMAPTRREPAERRSVESKADVRATEEAESEGLLSQGSPAGNPNPAPAPEKVKDAPQPYRVPCDEEITPRSFVRSEVPPNLDLPLPKIDPNRLALGGVQLGMTYDEVLAVCSRAAQPDKIGRRGLALDSCGRVVSPTEVGVEFVVPDVSLSLQCAVESPNGGHPDHIDVTFLGAPDTRAVHISYLPRSRGDLDSALALLRADLGEPTERLDPAHDSVILDNLHIGGIVAYWPKAPVVKLAPGLRWVSYKWVLDPAPAVDCAPALHNGRGVNFVGAVYPKRRCSSHVVARFLVSDAGSVVSAAISFANPSLYNKQFEAHLTYLHNEHGLPMATEQEHIYAGLHDMCQVATTFVLRRFGKRPRKAVIGKLVDELVKRGMNRTLAQELVNGSVGKGLFDPMLQEISEHAAGLFCSEVITEYRESELAPR